MASAGSNSRPWSVDAASLSSVVAAGLGISLNSDASRTVLKAALAPHEGAADQRRLPAAALMDYADAVCIRRGAERWPVEMDLRERAARLTGAALGVAELQRRVDEGTRIGDIEIDAIASGGR